MNPNNIDVERVKAPQSRFTPLLHMHVERGTKSDWDALHALHYKSDTQPPGAHYWRCVTDDGELVGVVILSLVGLLNAARHEVFPALKPGQDTKFTNVRRATFINANFCRAARIVTDTLYRGVGVSYRMVNLAMRMEGKKYVEIISSMSKFNPFDVKAGFRHANLRHARAYEKGITFFSKYFEAHPADHQAILLELDSMPESMRNGTIQALREFYYRHSAKEKTGGNLNVGIGDRVTKMSPSLLLKELQQLVFASPAYGIWENPDLGRELPEKLPLIAFDNQLPTEKLRLDKL